MPFKVYSEDLKEVLYSVEGAEGNPLDEYLDVECSDYCDICDYFEEHNLGIDKADPKSEEKRI